MSAQQRNAECRDSERAHASGEPAASGRAEVAPLRDEDEDELKPSGVVTRRGWRTELSGGRTVGMLVNPDGSFTWVFVNNGVKTKIRLSREAFAAMLSLAEDADFLIDSPSPEGTRTDAQDASRSQLASASPDAEEHP